MCAISRPLLLAALLVTFFNLLSKIENFKQQPQPLLAILRITKIAFTFLDGGIGFGKAHHSSPNSHAISKMVQYMQCTFNFDTFLVFSQGEFRAVVCYPWFKPLNHQYRRNAERVAGVTDVRNFNEFKIDLDFVGFI